MRNTKYNTKLEYVQFIHSNHIFWYKRDIQILFPDITILHIK